MTPEQCLIIDSPTRVEQPSRWISFHSLILTLLNTCHWQDDKSWYLISLIKTKIDIFLAKFSIAAKEDTMWVTPLQFIHTHTHIHTYTFIYVNLTLIDVCIKWVRTIAHFTTCSRCYAVVFKIKEKRKLMTYKYIHKHIYRERSPPPHFVCCRVD